MTSFHILIATTGRPFLQQMLNSLSPQLLDRDCLTIVFDGCSEIPTFDFKNFKCKVNKFNEPTALGFWGHGVRNKYASLLEPRDFVMHADDDDLYKPDAFSMLRNRCKDSSKLYIAKTRTNLLNIQNTESGNTLENIATPCGIIPYELNKQGTWAEKYGGDDSFYQEIIQKVSTIELLKIVIYEVLSIAGHYRIPERPKMKLKFLPRF
jgi:hypothetical protein